MEILLKWIVPIGMTIMMAPMLAGLMSVFVAIGRQILWVPMNRHKYIERAVEEGRVLRAVLLESQHVHTRNGQYYQNTYEYIHEGKKYTYLNVHNIWMNEYYEAPKELTLYYQKNPSRACEDRNIGSDEWHFGKIFLYTLLLCATGIFCFIKFYLVGQFF